MRRNQVIFSYFGDELLKALDERTFAHRTQHLHDPISVIPPRQIPKTRERKGFKQVGTVDVRPAIALALEGEHGIGPGVHGVINHARKMNT